jgi:type I restriction-modification system DNA methylase subunit/predicted type IV restriction endonuclease
MAAPTQIAELVERFESHLETYRSADYNEAQLREEFVNPFFHALGWDVYNRKGYSDAYKDVIHEAAIKVGGQTKAPDYCFRAGGGRASFFVEAKKPAVGIGEAISPAFQLRRYAWSAKLPVSILTDFAELAVYDCRVRPVKTDKATIARVLLFNYTEYVDRWDELHGLISPEAIRRGALERFLASKKVKKGTAEVDAAFLAEIETWRDLLARNFALRNDRMAERDLNFAVQRTIDRTVFLRICEDRGIEPYGTLQAVANGPNLYRRLGELFQRADERYNSGLFHFSAEKERTEPPDEMTLALEIDDKPLKDIIEGLYYPESPYEFSVLPTEILGQVYEQFLGKLIRLTKGHQAKVEEKPEVRKAGGVYYTPAYIVDYIVDQTVGKLLEGKTPAQAAKLRVLDPACGSGSFLIGVYQRLLDWHRDRYVADDAEKHVRGRNPRLYRGAAGEWRLTAAERKRILLNSVYGVDIDPQAVEVTKLSLLLKVLEGESKETINNQLRLFHQRALPDLGRNIKCGNSLIGPDFYEGRQKDLFDEETVYRINAFDWKAEFPEILRGPGTGFNAVIGNPPYVLLQDDFRDDAQLEYFRKKYSGASYKLDTYHLFMEQAVGLAAVGGRCSMITPANFLTNNHLAGLRRLLLTRSSMDHVVVIDGGVFRGVSVDSAVFVAEAGAPSSRPFRIVHSRPSETGLQKTREATLSVAKVLKDRHVLFTGTAKPAAARLWERVRKRGVPLGALAEVNFGKQLRDRKEYSRDVIQVPSRRSVRPPYRCCYTGRDISRYVVTWGNLACLDDDDARRGGCWDPEKQNAKNKLLTRQIGRYPEFALDCDGFQCLNTLFMVNPRCDVHPLFLLGVLNSMLLRALWLERFYDQRRTFPKIKGAYLKELPIPAIELDDTRQRARHDQMVELVEGMLSLHSRLAEAKTEHAKTLLGRQIEATDRQIDQLVYQLYGLSDEEVRIVEQAVSEPNGTYNFPSR